MKYLWAFSPKYGILSALHHIASHKMCAEYEGCLDDLEMDAETAKHLFAQDQSLLDGARTGEHDTLPEYAGSAQSQALGQDLEF